MYATLAEAKTHLSIPQADEADDALLTIALNAASSMIERYCHRVFTTGTTAEERFFTSDLSGIVWTDDICDEDVTVVVDGTTITDLTLEPINASTMGRPWEWVFSSRIGRSARNGVSITAKWGWPSLPDTIKPACLIQAARIFSRKSSPYGIAGSPETGELRLLAKLDPDVEMLLSNLRRFVIE